ncbi:MAG: hypothetical protein RUMPE_00165 [Eubacteriales bacterium SKADARSKE-1]|nr:hypothetical protein [Eubacteriales bacterium SKADARSKE-1]
MSNENNEKVDNLLNKVSQYLGQNSDELKKAAQSGDMSKALGSLNAEDSQKIQKVLSDKNLASKLLSTPQAQKLIKDLLGEK